MSDSSIEVCVVVEDSDSDEQALTDSGVSLKSDADDEMMRAVQKIDLLNDKFQEQSRLLLALKEEILNSRVVMEKAITDLISVVESCIKDLAEIEGGIATEATASKRLLAALEARLNPDSIDKPIIKDVFSTLLRTKHFQELKERMMNATAESIKEMIEKCLSRDFSELFAPILEQAHKRLVHNVAKAVEETFYELEANSVVLFKTVNKDTRTLMHYIDGTITEAKSSLHNNLKNTLRCSMEELARKETRQWGQTVVTAQLQTAALPATPLEVKESRAHGLDPHIDTLAKAAEITRLMSVGDVNAAFELALNARDLPLLRCACRVGAGPAVTSQGGVGVTSYGSRLRPHVLLALLQQLSADVHYDTHLKCRFLEDAIISLDPSDPVTRSHLPLVVHEIRNHLTNFIACYPGHAASRRLAFIVLAADSLLK